MSTIRSICVYCGSSPGNSPVYLEAGRALGNAIAEAGLTLVYGGGLKGIMGAVANGAVDAGGHVTGIIPRFLIRKEAGDETGLDHLDEVILTEDMHERKHAMFERSDAFVALPGGIGTVEEIVEIMTWAQLGRHQKPMVFGNVGGFWNPMLALIDHMKAEGFIHSQHMVRPLVVDEPSKIVPSILDAARATADAEGDQAIIERM
ncbi:MAG: TIGR00730 family Rossman fold protein [Aliihoeflea sp.]|uniref:LOG family protein n=1 Tax=Aliihoeflea sp. 40Bstr573 TaxID=2696467 RepID=UPI002094666C|nr:TIGR00730 family Rossman fold protein [Aliihoeflea sp. 40Bstr573]MCO6387821.1 TIGR00730 family Rossman fold protein [Aliihoeflea sp. 40Bstr573]